MTKAAERRATQRDLLVEAAEHVIAAKGLAGLNSRDLARTIGISNGAVFNLVPDMDELVLRVGSRTLARLGADLAAAETQGDTPQQALVLVAIAYCDFAAASTELWRVLFEHRMAAGRDVPDWAIEDQTNLFLHIYRPLASLFPDLSSRMLEIRARSMFSAVHGLVALGMERKLIAVPVTDLRREVEVVVAALIDGLMRQGAANI
jgi:AcrR family transcriptional regulator